MEKREYEIANIYDPLFTNYTLTDAMTYKNGKKKGLRDNVAVLLLLDKALNPYGISCFGATHLRTSDNKETDVMVGYTFIDRFFPPENWFIIKEMYGWKGESLVNMSIKIDDGFMPDFDFNTHNYSCTLNIPGSDRRYFTSIPDMLTAINTEEFFKLEEV